jgi:phage terminase Nu1 subunit (DNA packaging protein)
LNQTAGLLGVDRATVSAWIRRGCPVVSKADRSLKKEWALDLAAVVEWRIKRAVDDAVGGLLSPDGKVSKDEADRRKAVAQARLAEVELDERIGAVILVADAQENSADFAQALRSGLDNVAVKCAGRTATMNDPNEIRQFIEDEINRAMRVAQQILREKWAETLDGKSADPDADRADTDNEEND